MMGEAGLYICLQASRAALRNTPCIWVRFGHDDELNQAESSHYPPLLIKLALERQKEWLKAIIQEAESKKESI
jgi:hypothetical protein